jgi:hypothetical protein
MMSYKLAQVLVKDIHREVKEIQKIKSAQLQQRVWLQKELLLVARRLRWVHSGTTK